MNNFVYGTIHTYNEESLPIDLLIYRHAGMFSIYDSPYIKKDGRSFIKVHLQFKRVNPEYHGEPMMVQVSIFEASNYQKIGYIPPATTDANGSNNLKGQNQQQRLFCCSPELKEKGICDEEFTLIIEENEGEGTYVHDVEFLPASDGEYESSLEDDEKEEKEEQAKQDAKDKKSDKDKKKKKTDDRQLAQNSEENDDDEDNGEDIEEQAEADSEKDKSEFKSTTGIVTVERTFPIESKGMYYLMFSSCNELTGEVLISGKVEWMNPYGYLPGELYGFLPFYAKMSVIYLLIAIGWTIMCALYWRQLLMLQNCITAVIALSMIEVSLRYFDFATFNKFGTRSIGMMLSAAIFQTVKKTVSRLLVLVVSLGYGILRPTLGPSGQRVILLGGTYFIFASVQHVVESVSHTVTITVSQYLLMLPVAALDLVFYFWIFRALGNTIEQLQTRKQEAKLGLYSRFQKVLIASVALSVGWSMYYLYVIISNKIQSQWESRWIYDGFWDVIYLMVLVPIMILWRPTMNSQQYEYSKVAGDDFYDDEDGENTNINDKEEYGSNLKPNPATITPSNAPSNRERDVIDDMEDVMNAIVDSKPVVVKKD